MEHFYKMMIFENPVWMENDFRVGIFEIFHFQKHAPNMDISRVKKFQNSKILIPSTFDQSQKKVQHQIYLHLNQTNLWMVGARASTVQSKSYNNQEKICVPAYCHKYQKILSFRSPRASPLHTVSDL